MPIPACPVPIAPDGSIVQPLNYYGQDDHLVWKELFIRQTQTLQHKVCPEFLEGLNQLPFDSSGVPNLEEVSNRLYEISKFRLVPVGGLISSKLFFNHLAHRRFTVGWFVRTREQLDYLEEPDLFHDLYGHVPLLTNKVYADFMQQIGLVGLEICKRFNDNPKQQDIMANALLRLYWFTVEFGLIQNKTPNASNHLTNNDPHNTSFSIYGAGIASSFSEVPHALYNPEVKRVLLDSLDRIIRTKYYIDKVQQLYFVIPSFESLFSLFSQKDLVEQIIYSRGQPMYPIGTILPTDILL
jgi:phenylalanine-4-hydroxylase